MNSAFRNIWCITKRELTGYFNSPVAYVFIVIFLLFANFFCFMLGGFFDRGQANLESFFTWHPWLFIVFYLASLVVHGFCAGGGDAAVGGGEAPGHA